MRPGWNPEEETQKADKPTLFERIVLAIGIGAILFACLLYGCVVRGQDAPTMLDVQVVFDETNAVNTPTLLKRPAQPMVPALPQARRISRTVSTNDQGERVTVTIEKPPEPAALVQDRPKTNAFWVMCPHCSVRAIRAPVRMETNGVVTVPDGDTIERTIYFRCCKTEFRARNFKFVETPIAEEVTLPTPGAR